jgi:hypothetical protein
MHSDVVIDAAQCHIRMARRSLATPSVRPPYRNDADPSDKRTIESISETLV